MAIDLRQRALECLITRDPLEKVLAVQNLVGNFEQGNCEVNVSITLKFDSLLIPGRPEKPVLVDPMTVKKRSMNTVEGRAALLHALTHIEFNAINLALDAIWRFPEMPLEYYTDWLRVAREESVHFSLLNHHISALGYEYGSFPGHNSLWEMVQKTSGDVLARMALVPRTMESRGLDALPAIRQRFVQIKDQIVVDILEIILRDEVGHVLIGNRWFNHLCQKRALDPIKIYRELARTYKAPTLRGPFNMEARKEAGFSDAELDEMLCVAQGNSLRS